MIPIKPHYFRWRISQPEHYKERAIQMGEIAGAWLAELIIADVNSDWFTHANKMHDRYHKRMLWYARKAIPYNSIYDYET